MTHSTEATCMHPRCSNKPVSAAALHRAAPGFPATGMCSHHTLAAIVKGKRRQGEIALEPQPAEEYTQWVSRAHASGTLTVEGLTVRGLSKADIEELTGVSRNALASIASGNTRYVQARTAHKLMPWVIYANPAPAPAAGIRIFGQYKLKDLRGAPLGTVIVDSKGLAWQKHGYSHAGVWRSASDYNYPINTREAQGTVHVVYLPPRHITRSRT